MTDAELAAIHAAAMTLPRPWSSSEIGALRLMPGLVEIALPGGFALGRVMADEAELLTIAVHPDHRRAGLGTALLGSYHDAALCRGAATSFLEVAETNAGARALYARAGYTPAGRRKGYYTEATPPVDALILQRSL